MATYKSISAALKDLLNFNKLLLGKAVKTEIQNTIISNSVMGDPLAESTINAKGHNTKLLDTGELKDSIVVNVEKSLITIGYADKVHNETNKIGSSSPITMANLAKVHNEGAVIKNNRYTKRVPKRPFLFVNGQWTELNKNAVKEFYRLYLASKNII